MRQQHSPCRWTTYNSPAKCCSMEAPCKPPRCRRLGRVHHSGQRSFQKRRTSPQSRTPFSHACERNGEERNIQFTAPRLAQSHLLLRLPKGSAFIQALVKYGVQKPAGDGDPYSLDVELGRVAAALHLRWVLEKPNGAAPRPAIEATRSVSLGSPLGFQQLDGFPVVYDFSRRGGLCSV